MLTFFAVSFMISVQALSILSNRLASSGSWSRISSLPMKMLSRYIHLRCTAIQVSKTSPIKESFPSHSSTSSANGCTNRLAIMLCRVRFMSSRITVVSSVERKIHPRSTSPLTYFASVNFCSRHTAPNFEMSNSILSSFSAATHISSTASTNLCVSMFKSEPRVNVAGSTEWSFWPHIRISLFQCRARNASDFSASNRGSESENAST
mmetsp:Transcript_7546/g.28375  ORF Transcript_7546/g.28375 Transcript_7546/m.28375 type:complete len:207 (+) Transcript_7546:978-1598(+)